MGICCRYGLVSGVVQGVGFRQFVRGVALRHGLSGFARNLPDGRVEVMLRGPTGEVGKVQDAVAQGPTVARVHDIHWEDRSPDAAPNGFSTG